MRLPNANGEPCNNAEHFSWGQCCSIHTVERAPVNCWHWHLMYVHVCLPVCTPAIAYWFLDHALGLNVCLLNLPHKFWQQKISPLQAPVSQNALSAHSKVTYMMTAPLALYFFLMLMMTNKYFFSFSTYFKLLVLLKNRVTKTRADPQRLLFFFSSCILWKHLSGYINHADLHRFILSHLRRRQILQQRSESSVIFPHGCQW